MPEPSRLFKSADTVTSQEGGAFGPTRTEAFVARGLPGIALFSGPFYSAFRINDKGNHGTLLS